MDTAGVGDIRVLRKLGPPAILDTALTELTGFAGERRCKALAVVLELVGMARVGGDVVAEGVSGIRRVARQDAANRWSK